ncbi:hypothetical protein HR12_00255 [Microbacterium sp. SUBG005]|nr:hypothetical protein HR12_00255 [Microbacterium sp. SUBG005]
MTRGSILPAGRQFVLTWGIPREYGGLTSALLQRSRLFAGRGATPVHVLTCDDRHDRTAVAAELCRRDGLSAGVTLTNLWEWLRENDLRGRPVSGGAGFAPLPADATRSSRAGCSSVASGWMPTGRCARSTTFAQTGPWPRAIAATCRTRPGARAGSS